MAEFRLCEGVFFVKGTQRGAIYDTNSGNVYSVNASACKVIQGETNNETYWLKLQEVGLAETGNCQLVDVRVLPKQEPQLRFIWFEIVSDDCNLWCRQCYTGSMPPSCRKGFGACFAQIAPVYKSQNNKLKYEVWLSLIQQGYELDCRRCQFIGGEPFLYRGENGETVLDLAESACGIGYDFIEIFTNATLLNKERVAQIKNLGIHMAVSLYSNKSEVHDAITRVPGSHHKTMQSLQLLKDAGVPVRVAIVLMRQNQQTIDDTVRVVEEMGFRCKGADLVRPAGRGDNSELQPDNEILIRYGLMTVPNFYVDHQRFSQNYSGNSCLAGKITITDVGTVLPCVFWRDKVIGNIAVNTLAEIVFTENLQKVWQTTKDSVLVCRDCEYRYVCSDCRPLAHAVTGGLVGELEPPYPRCTYNPYTGQWAGGVWGVNKKGEVYYETDLETLINRVNPAVGQMYAGPARRVHHAVHPVIPHKSGKLRGSR